MKRFIFVLSTITSLVFIFSSCGVMFGGSKFSGSIIAKDHPDAEIYVDGNKIGKGAAIGLYRRNKPLTVELRQDGCEPRTETFNNTMRTGMVGLSLVCWGLVGIAIDFGTGGAYKPDHKNYPAIEKVSSKNFTFTVDYPGCLNEVIVADEN